MNQITDEQYCNVTNLNTLRSAQRVLSDVCFFEGTKNKDKLLKVRLLIHEMTEELQVSIEGVICEEDEDTLEPTILNTKSF